ncbi:MAG TPA: alpha-L-arabinofuranosidase C-terminal domain-containing protein [Gemmatimonadales bacterium]
MKPFDRRDFIGAAMAAGATALLPRRAAARRASVLADSRIEILLDEPIGTIAPEIYGHFTEHLGGVIYDGVWVGENSPVPNVGGVRKALVEALQAIKPAVIRWPGGCFADSYDWRDGVGPRERRPRRTNFWADDPHFKDLGDIPAKYDPNEFGTTEFMHFCHLVGAQPYLAANVRSLPARAFMEWLEYCNSPADSTTWSVVRGVAGDRGPYGVRFWGVGNESWGCGGNFTPEEYAAEVRRFTTWAVPAYGVDLAFVASGPSGGDLEWTRRFFAAQAERGALDRMWGWALHHYCSADGAGADAVAFDDRGWYDLLASADRMESLITAHWQAMRQLDRDHKIKLVVDEWGAWHKTAPLVDPSHLFESQSTIRDALVAGLTLDTFNRHADKVAMANVAQLINCIHSLFFSHAGQFVVTPSYHVFAMYAAHQGAQAVRTVWSAPRVDKLWGLAGSASQRDKALTLTVTNPSLGEPRDTEIAVRGGAVSAARATTLAAKNVHDVNSFERPDVVKPAAAAVAGRGAVLTYRFPPASVTKLELTLG